MMKSRVGRPDRDADDLGDPVERQIEVVVQDHHRAMVDGQPAEAALELVAIDDRAQAIVRRSARPSAAAGGWAPSDALSDPRRSRRARGAGTTRRRSAPGRGAAEGPARWSAAPAASHPRQGRCRAGSCAPRQGTDRRSRWRRGRRPPCHRAGLGSRDRYPCLFRMTASASSDAYHTVWVDRGVEVVNLRWGRLAKTNPMSAAPSLTMADPLRFALGPRLRAPSNG